MSNFILRGLHNSYHRPACRHNPRNSERCPAATPRVARASGRRGERTLKSEGRLQHLAHMFSILDVEWLQAQACDEGFHEALRGEASVSEQGRAPLHRTTLRRHSLRCLSLERGRQTRCRYEPPYPLGSGWGCGLGALDVSSPCGCPRPPPRLSFVGHLGRASPHPGEVRA